MKIFEKNILKFLLELYDAHTSAGYDPPRDKRSIVEEIQIALHNPEKYRCHYKSRDLCCYSLSPYHMDRCVGIKNCKYAMEKKKEKQAIMFE